MKCKVCGAESGKYPLCRACNLKKDRGEIIKCPTCNNWHLTSSPCPIPQPIDMNAFLYEAKPSLMSKSEQGFYHAILISLPEGYRVFPQINLATFIDRTDDARFHNELYRNVDFLITDSEYTPKFIIEVNDQTHLNHDRKERDEKVRKICEEAGIPILTLWTSYGVNEEYIKRKVEEFINAPTPQRLHHFTQTTAHVSDAPPAISAPYTQPRSKQGCYVATCVYGSYDCSPVWVLRRYRDSILSKTKIGRAFISVYYFCSPWLVKVFGEQLWFVRTCRAILDSVVNKLQAQGFENTPYQDVG